MSGENGYILVSARYDSVADAEAGYQSVMTAYEAAGQAGFDAAVYSRDRWERLTLHLGTAAPKDDSSGRPSLAKRVGESLFEGLVEMGGGAGDPDIADVAGSTDGDDLVPTEDLQRLAAVITPGSAALLVAYRPDDEPLVTPNLHSARTATSHEVHASDAALRSQVHDARKSARPQSNRGATGV